MTQTIGMTDEIRALRARMKDFIDGVVFSAEAELEREAEDDLQPETGLPLELYAALERAHGRAQSRGQAARALGARASEGDRRRWAAVHGLRVSERDHPDLASLRSP